jgi:predicted acetyltransferase
MSTDADRLVLVRPALAHAASYFEFIDELRAHGDTIWSSRVPSEGEDHDAFVTKLLAKEHTAEPPSVPESVHWAVVDERVVGVIALRHRLTERLARFGGHVGYEVRPSSRRRGVATAMLRQLLHTERARSMGRILVTCAPSNVGSRRAIEASGGVLEGIVFIEEVERETCHYWIDVSALAGTHE